MLSYANRPRKKTDFNSIFTFGKYLNSERLKLL